MEHAHYTQATVADLRERLAKEFGLTGSLSSYAVVDDFHGGKVVLPEDVQLHDARLTHKQAVRIVRAAAKPTTDAGGSMGLKVRYIVPFEVLEALPRSHSPLLPVHPLIYVALEEHTLWMMGAVSQGGARVRHGGCDVKC
jgi:hypothetical protein